MLRSWYQQRAAKKTPTSGRLRQRASRRRSRYRPQLEPLEARLVLYDHVWSDGTCIFNCTNNWADEQNWSNGSPAGDPDPGGAVVIFPEDAGSDWDRNFEDIPGELPVKSLYYHRGGFVTLGGASETLLLSQDIFTDLGGSNRVDPAIRFTSDAQNHEHLIQVNNGGVLDLRGNLTSGTSALLDKDGNGTLALWGNNQNYGGVIALHQGTLLLASANALAEGTPIVALDAGTVLDLNNFDRAASVQTTVSGNLRLGSGNLFFTDGSDADIEGTISGSGGLTVDGRGQVTLGVNGTFSYTGPTLVNRGTLFVDGNLANHPITVEGGTLSGGGTVGAVTVRGGTVHPGSRNATQGSDLLVEGNVLFEAGSFFEADIRGSAFYDYDHLTATGTIDLSNGETTLRVTGGSHSAEGDTFTILHSSDHIIGTFAGLPDNKVFAIQGVPFQIHYTNDSVVLTRLRQFLPPVYYPAGGSPVAVVTGDFNGDGKADLAVADATGPTDVSVLLGNGDGTFQSPLPLHVQQYAFALAVGHFHDPNILDLVVTERDQVEVFLGNGDGTFQAPVAYAVGMIPNSPVVGDVNGDGHDDIVVVNQTSRTLSILYGNGDGTFQNAVNLDFPSPGLPWSVALADLNGDGKLDLVTGNNNGTYGDASEVSVLLNLGNDDAGHAQFGAAAHYPTGMDAISLLVNDINGDGKPDVIFASGTGQAVGVFLGKVDGTLMGPPLLSATSFSSGGASLLASGDFDGDGKLDLTMPASYGRETVLYGKGDGTFGPPSYYPMASGTWAVATGDFNGDGAPDLAVAVHDGTVGILLNAVGRGPSTHPGGPSSRGRAPAPELGAADLVAFSGNWGAGTLAELPPISLAADGRAPAPRASEVAPVDRFFAVLGQTASGLAISRGRLPTEPSLDEVPWEPGIEDRLARDSLAGGDRRSSRP